MKIGVISFDYENRNNNDRYVIDIINNQNDCNLILFPGCTSLRRRFLNYLLDNITNQNSISIIEVAGEWFFIKHNRILNNISILQKIGDGKEARNKTKVMELFDELEENRRVIINNKVIRLLICGEIYITKSIRNRGIIEFRHSDPELINRFNEICEDTDIYLNPAHRPMKGWLGNITMRCSFFSRNSKIFIYTNNKAPDRQFKDKRHQYIFQNRSKIENPNDVTICDSYRISSYDFYD